MYAAAPDTADFRLKTLDFGLPSWPSPEPGWLASGKNPPDRDDILSDAVAVKGARRFLVFGVAVGAYAVPIPPRPLCTNGRQSGPLAHIVRIALHPVILSATGQRWQFWTPAMNKRGLIHRGFVHR